MDLNVLKIWPDWKATRLIGEGSYGKVYEIVRTNFGIEEHCALKVISIPSSPAELQSMRNDGMDDQSVTAYFKGLVEEFVQEIALMSKLKGNPHVVGYEDYTVIEHKDSIGWDILIRMELLTPLPEYIRNHAFTTNDIIQLGIDVCSALDVCHSQLIIHRDIKPDNIFISQNGDYKLGDFGVARTIDKNVSGLSKKGTYTYMAPEVYKGDSYGTNVDIYSLGIVMYKLLNSNREPFLPPYPEVIKFTDKNNALVRRLGGEVIPPPANANPYLGKIVLKACEYHAASRYHFAKQLMADLIAAKEAIKSGTAPILQANHIAASKTKTGTNSNSISCNSKTNISARSIPNATVQRNMNGTVQRNTNATIQRNVNPNVPPHPNATVRIHPNATTKNIPNAPTQPKQNAPTQPKQNAPTQRSKSTSAPKNTNAPIQKRPNPTTQTKTQPNIQKSANPPTQKREVQSTGTDKGNLVITTLAVVLGWMGIIIWSYLSMYIGIYLMAMTSMSFILMIPLSIPALGNKRKIFAGIMIFFGVMSFNVFSIASAILFMFTKSNKN